MNSTPTAEISTATASAPTYTIGTLRYDRRSLAVLFGWLLWGDFAFHFFESVFGRFMPLYLKELQASNTLIGITTGSIAGLVNVLFLPNISQWSDRLRTRLGRRKPFLLVVTPLTTLSLLSVGFAPEISRFLGHYVTTPFAPGLTGAVLLLPLICLSAVSFHFFNMVLVNSYNWLLRDVVPQSLMTRFLSWFRVVGTVASVLFLWFVFPTMLSHREITFLLVGLFYFSSFMLMCWKVKEGDYPEPAIVKSNFVTRFGTYFRDCLSVPLYRNFFAVYVLVIVASGSAGSFLTLYARHTLHLEMADMGRIWATSALVSAVAYAPMGWLCEKFTAMKVVMASILLLLASALLAYLFVDSQKSWFVYSVLNSLPLIGWTLGSLAITMHLFPEKAFGQFASGLNVFGCGGLILGNYLIGEFMDFIGSQYHLVFIWSGIFYAAAFLPMIAVYRGWKRHGGPHHYIAPVPRHW